MKQQISAHWVKLCYKFYFTVICSAILYLCKENNENGIQINLYLAHKLLQNILGTLFFKAERHVSDSQLFRAYWMLGNVLHLMYMNFSEPPYKICIIVFRVSQAA